MTENYDPKLVGPPQIVGQPTSPAMLVVTAFTPASFEKGWAERLEPLFEVRPDLRLTILAPPLLMGPPPVAREGLKWGMYGFAGAHYECRAWTEDEAEENLQAGIEMGYDPIIAPPTWAWDAELGFGCVKTDTVLFHTREQDPKTPGLLAYPGPKHLRDTGLPHFKVFSALDGIKYIGAFSKYAVEFRYSRFLTPDEVALQVPIDTSEAWEKPE